MRIAGYDIGLFYWRKAEQRNANALNYNPSNLGWSGFMLPSSNLVNVIVNKETALSVPAIWAAVRTISETLASLPFSIYQRTDNGSQEATGHPLYNLVKLEPSPDYSSYDFRRALVANACFGNAYAKIYRNGIGRAVRLELLDPAMVTPWQDNNGARWYIVVRQLGDKPIYETLRQDEVLHIKGLTLDGIAGKDVVNTHRDTLGMSIAANQYGAAFFGNGAHVGGVLEYPLELTEPERAKISQAIDAKYGGVGHVGKTMVLDAGMKYTKTGLNPNEAMLNDARNFQVLESSRIFGVPAHLLSQLDRATFSNIEVMNVQFVNQCLRPFAVGMEQEFARKLLTASEKASGEYFFRTNLDGLLRGDTEARAKYYDTMIKSMVYTINDVRALENMNTVPWGDTPYAQAGVTKLSEDGQVEAPPQDQQQTDPTPAPGQNSNTNEGGAA